MKRLISIWRDQNHNTHKFIGEGPTVADCKTAISEQMHDVEDDFNKDIAFLDCLGIELKNI